MVNAIRNWRIEDPAPNIPLSSISPLSKRGWALLARSKHNPLLQQHCLQIAGAVSMMKGLDYHHARFMDITESLARGEQTDDTPLVNEAVAYANRVGQFRYFARSKFVKSHLGTVTIPKIDELVIFRNKHGSHRSFDTRQAYDDPQIREGHAMSLSEFGGKLFLPKQPLPPDFSTLPWRLAYREFQMHTGRPRLGRTSFTPVRS